VRIADTPNGIRTGYVQNKFSITAMPSPSVIRVKYGTCFVSGMHLL